VDHDPVNLALVGMQQDDAATAAGLVHRMLARREQGRSLQDDADCRRGDYSKGNTSGHDMRSLSGRSTISLSVTDAHDDSAASD
jgi:hypothetical protein